jgi:hypothetical protein
MPPQEVFHSGCTVVAVLEPDYLWRHAAGSREVEKIGIGGYDRKTIGSGVLPNDFVRGEPGESGVENVD